VKVYELAEENRSLRELLDQKASIKRDPQFGYWFKEGETEPLCLKCYEGKECDSLPFAVEQLCHRRLTTLVPHL
jgi:hypothetical protein